MSQAHDASRGRTPPPPGADSLTAWLPDLIYLDGHFEPGRAVIGDELGRVVRFVSANEVPTGVRLRRLAGRAMLPGLVNAHSHAFQRVIRGRTERRHPARAKDSFWTWREAMYAAAARLTPEDLYDASRMAFLEMIVSGITAVGEFHYLHRTASGATYDDPNLLAKQVVRAARDVGLRICLLRVAYARAGFKLPPDKQQLRFIEPEPHVFLRHAEMLQRDVRAAHAADEVWTGVAPHSVRAVPLAYLREVIAYTDAGDLPVHMHVAEQPAEVEACAREHGLTPVNLLSAEGLIGPRFVAVHAIHLGDDEVRHLADGAGICACPTTERNLGDGVVPADRLWRANVPVALGTDSQAQIDLFEDARELEYHLRLQRLERVVLAAPGSGGDHHHGVLLGFPGGGREEQMAELATKLFACATAHGAAALAAPGGALEPGRPLDFLTVALDDPSIAGADREDLLPAIIFSLSRAAIRDVAVGGKLRVENGAHADAAEIVTRFGALQEKLWRKI